MEVPIEKELSSGKAVRLSAVISDYIQLSKLRLSFLVVFSAALAFIMGSPDAINWNKLILLIAGGFLVTGASNAINQVIERNLDKLMDRTRNRPLPDERMSPVAAIIAAVLMGITGLLILTFFMNAASGVLGFIALVSYAWMYTPLKRITPFAVFVGAIPGAIPPLLGWVAATGSFSGGGWMLFALQFLWQFPHFWAIAWVMDDDYRKAGFELLPSKGGRDKASAMQAFVYAFSLIPLCLMLKPLGFCSQTAALLTALISVGFAAQAYRLYATCSMESAKKLMFGSFFYLPLAMIILLIDKLL
ncbi:MAG TPA: heme o synthase [Bacteroidia bacterium]|nr:heme o synthase [Bacteroidia bacterium]